MKLKYKKWLFGFGTLMYILVPSLQASGQIRDSYLAAARACRETAKKTKCPNTARALEEMARYNECLADALTSNIRPCGNVPTIPPCDGDVANATSAGTGTSNAQGKYQQRYEQTQIQLNNAQLASDQAYQAAIANGRKGSGALLDATFAGASQISDAQSSLIYTGVGLATSLLMHMGEKKAERLEKEAEIRREAERKEKIIEVKKEFIKDALAINQYSFSDLISADRYLTVLLSPVSLTAENQVSYFSIPVKVPRYDDRTFPLRDEIEKQVLISIAKALLTGRKLNILYPVVNVDKFQDDFTKKMGSGHLVYLTAELLNFTTVPFIKQINTNDETDFWGSPKKGTRPKENKPSKKEADFWNN